MMMELGAFDARLVELGVRVARLLAADVRTFFPQAVRDRFAEQPALSDALDDGAVTALKRETLDAAHGLAALVESRLGVPTAWLSAAPPAREPGGSPSLTDHTPVAEIVALIETTVSEFLRARGLGGESVTYRLPMRFIDGDNLATLTQNVWKTVARRHEQRLKADASEVAAAQGDRKRRWDEA